MTNEQRLAILEMAMEVWRENKSRDPVDLAARMAKFVARGPKTHQYESSWQDCGATPDFVRCDGLEQACAYVTPNVVPASFTYPSED